MAYFFGDGMIYTADMGRPLGSKNKYSGMDRFPTCYEVDAATGCWNWIKSRGSHGYGDFRRDGHKLAHRWSYATFVGSIPDGAWVLHRCDNHRCVNPEHLFLGNATDNNQDMVGKGRHYSKGKTFEEVYGTEEAARKRKRLSQHLLANPISSEDRQRAVEATRGKKRTDEWREAQRTRMKEFWTTRWLSRRKGIQP